MKHAYFLEPTDETTFLRILHHLTMGNMVPGRGVIPPTYENVGKRMYDAFPDCWLTEDDMLLSPTEDTLPRILIPDTDIAVVVGEPHRLANQLVLEQHWGAPVLAHERALGYHIDIRGSATAVVDNDMIDEEKMF